jgi:hypothetical protein
MIRKRRASVLLPCILFKMIVHSAIENHLFAILSRPNLELKLALEAEPCCSAKMSLSLQSTAQTIQDEHWCPVWAFVLHDVPHRLSIHLSGAAEILLSIVPVDRQLSPEMCPKMRARWRVWHKRVKLIADKWEVRISMYSEMIRKVPGFFTAIQ